MDVKVIECALGEIESFIIDHATKNKITVDGYWEDHVIKSNHYKMTNDDEIVGYFAIFKEGDDPHKDAILTLFNVFPPFANKSQELFAIAKKYETVTHAMVAIGDEAFLSHCFDNFSKIEKLAYIFEYITGVNPKPQPDFKLAETEADYETFKIAKGFLDEEIKQLQSGVKHLEIYIAEKNNETIGFGIIEYGRILKNIASIGMYVCENYRRQGFAVDILLGMKKIVNDKGLKALSGCWYYNHNSKKSIEKAGGYCKTRYIKFYF